MKKEFFYGVGFTLFVGLVGIFAGGALSGALFSTVNFDQYELAEVKQLDSKIVVQPEIDIKQPETPTNTSSTTVIPDNFVANNAVCDGVKWNKLVGFNVGSDQNKSFDEGMKNLKYVMDNACATKVVLSYANSRDSRSLAFECEIMQSYKTSNYEAITCKNSVNEEIYVDVLDFYKKSGQDVYDSKVEIKAPTTYNTIMFYSK